MKSNYMNELKFEWLTMRKQFFRFAVPVTGKIMNKREWLLFIILFPILSIKHYFTTDMQYDMMRDLYIIRGFKISGEIITSMKYNKQCKLILHGGDGIFKDTGTCKYCNVKFE